MSTLLTADEIARFQRIDTPTVCNLIELFDVRPRNTGYMDERIKCCYPELPPMVGFAATATFRSDAPPRGGDVYNELDKQLASFAEIPGPPVVVFQDLDDPSVAATFGEVMCSTYKAFGAAGLITSGTGRDLDQVRSLKFPAFVSGINCSHAYCHILQLNVPVRAGGITVYPGDLLHGDCNGVTTVPLEIKEPLLDAFEEFMAAEGEVLNYVRQPNPTVEGFTAARKRMGERVKALRDKITKGK